MLLILNIFGNESTSTMEYLQVSDLLSGVSGENFVFYIGFLSCHVCSIDTGAWMKCKIVIPYFAPSTVEPK